MRFFLYQPTAEYVEAEYAMFVDMLYESDAPLLAEKQTERVQVPGNGAQAKENGRVTAQTVVFTEGQMLADPGRWAALKAWRAHDDSAFEATEAALGILRDAEEAD